MWRYWHKTESNPSYYICFNVCIYRNGQESTSIGKESAANARSSATRGFKPSAVASSWMLAKRGRHLLKTATNGGNIASRYCLRRGFWSLLTAWYTWQRITTGNYIVVYKKKTNQKEWEWTRWKHKPQHIAHKMQPRLFASLNQKLACWEQVREHCLNILKKLNNTKIDPSRIHQIMKIKKGSNH